jgi:hypothetical protein
VDRRTAIKLSAAAIAWPALDTGEITAARAAVVAAVRGGQQFQPKFFTAQEWQTVRILVDLIIPADERSGSATQAGVPEFMDFVMSDQPNRQNAMRQGLEWLDTESRTRFSKTFVESSDPERRQILDDIAWPARARPEHARGVAFFNSFRDLTAGGFWSSKMGVEDLRFMGNVAVPEWNGCPPEALQKLGVSYG